jgi:hypothetical protein
LRRFLDPVKGHPDGTGFDNIHDCVHIVQKRVDILPVKGCEKGPVHFFVGLVRDDIGLVLDFLDPGDPGFRLVVMFQHIHEHKAALFDLSRQLFEEIEKFFFPGNNSHLTPSPCLVVNRFPLLHGMSQGGSFRPRSCRAVFPALLENPKTRQCHS